MNELIRIDNQNQVIEIIGKAISQGKYDIAAYITEALNDFRSNNALNPFSISEILFLNYKNLLSDTEILDKRSLYLIEFDDESVKVGISKNPISRINTLSNQKGRNVIRYAISEKITNFFDIENAIKKKFKDSNIKGEYFSCDFDEMLMAVKDKYDLDIPVSDNIYRKYEGQMVPK